MSNDRVELDVREVFHFSDGRTVFAGEVVGEAPSYIPPCDCELWLDGRISGRFRIEGEMLSTPRPTPSMRAVSTRSRVTTFSDTIDKHQVVLRCDLPRGK